MTLQIVPGSKVEGLPKWCPSWCANGPEGHRQAYDEIGEVDPGPASLHLSADVGRRLDTLTQPYTDELLRAGGGRWEAVVQADGATSEYPYPFINLELSDKERAHEVELMLTSAEARVLARHMNHLADLIDLGK